MPFPQYQTITLLSDPIGNNLYDALQVRFQKRFSGGLGVKRTLSLRAPHPRSLLRVSELNRGSNLKGPGEPLPLRENPDVRARDAALRPLQPNQQHTVRPRLRSRTGGPAPLAQVLSDARKQLPNQVDLSEHTLTTAGLFTDGSISGDPGLVTRLMLRRSNMLLAIDLALEMLSDAGRRNVPRNQMIGQFKRLADSAHRGYLLPEQQVGLDLYQAMIGKLMGLPELKEGAPFPPSDFVERETAILRQQRVALVESQPSLFNFAGSSK